MGSRPRILDRPLAVSDQRPTFYAQIPHELQDDPELDSYAISVYSALDSYRNLRSGRCDPSHESLFKRGKASHGKGVEVLALLRKKGWIDWITVKTKGGLRNHYSLLWREGGRPPGGRPEEGVVHEAEEGRPPGGRRVVHQADGNKREENRDKGTRDYSTSSSESSGPTPSNGMGEQKPEPEKKPEAHGLRLVKAWAESFKAHFGKDCVILWGRDVKLMNRVVESYGAADTEKMLHAFWRFRVKTGKPVTIPTFYGVADRVYFDIKDGGRGGRS